MARMERERKPSAEASSSTKPPPQGAGAAIPSGTARHQDRRANRRLREIERQMAALRWARRVLATWHAIHIPLGMALFVMAFVHIGAAVHYATLLR